MAEMRKLIQMRDELDSDSDDDDAATAYGSMAQPKFLIPGTDRYATGTMCKIAINRYAPVTLFALARSTVSCKLWQLCAQNMRLQDCADTADALCCA